MARPSEADLIGLAPTHLPSYWSGRFTAENERRSLRDFSSRDQVVLRQIYETLSTFFESLKPGYLDIDRFRKLIGEFVAAGEVDALVGAMQEFGTSTIQAGERPGIERTIHDLRGGAFQALSIHLELYHDQDEGHGLHSIYFLLRDHLKIMRNGVCDLDPERFAADESPLDHDALLLVEKWSQAEFLGATRPVQIKLDCRFTGTLCESCLEFSTLDRIIYNLMNNAAKYSCDGVVNFYMLPIPQAAPASVRFVFCNALEPSHRSKLEETFDGHLREIFRGGFTTGGNGLGLRICADFCRQAYGISDFQVASDGGYFGADWISGRFAAWFHWPVAHGIS
jgi:hypothetical protein